MVENIFNFLQLTERIATSGQPTEEQLGTIARDGYELVLNLALSGTDYALADEAGIVRDLGMKYIQIPVLWDNPIPEDFKCFVGVMEEYQDKKIYVHCAANMRVSVFMALYRILEEGWECEDAFVDVNKIWEPNDIWQTYIKVMLSQEA
jgi:protein tyrosine phosphatase (PTP) superfamily phosphohydrolase (DUF442 family)